MSDALSPLQKQLMQIEQAIIAQRASLQTILSEDELTAALAPLMTRQAAILAQLSEGSAQAVGQGSTAIATGGVNVSGSAGTVVTGDNNSLNLIIHQYSQGQKAPVDEATLRQQIASYLIWMADRYGRIELRGIKREGQQVVQLELDTIYVPLAAQAQVREAGRGQVVKVEGSALRDIGLDQLLGGGPRLAVIGGPGCGKTTVLLHLAWTLAQAILQNNPALAQQRLGLAETTVPLPIFIPLNAYASYRRELTKANGPIPAQERTLAAFISRYLIERQSGFELPDDFFRQVLRTGQQVILLLDGLDEVPDESERVQVRQAIEELVTGREQIKVVLTSRTVAYAGRTALGKGFQEIRVLPLTDEHIAALIGQAYTVLYPTDEGQRQKKVQELLTGIGHLEAERQRRLGKNAERLINSPLLIRMLLVVHFSERRLPEQRAELYQKATDTLLLPEHAPDEEVAERIGRLVGGSREVHRELVQYLAFRMHVQGETQGREISEEAVRAILNREPAYAPLVNDFLALTRLRGTLLEERLGMYRFIHLAFQEYLVARYLAEVERSVERIVAFLAEDHVLDSWWREPVLLLVGYLGLTSPATAQKLVVQMTPSQPTWSAPVRTAFLELATAATMEWQGAAPGVQAQITATWQTWLNDAPAIIATEPKQRAQAGQTLARWGDPREHILDVDKMLFCAVPAGPFWMGSGEDDQEARDSERPLHQVDITYPYWLSRYPVSNAQFQTFADDGGYRMARYWLEAEKMEYWKKGQYQDRDGPYDPGTPFNLPNHPVVNISWYEALAFCRWLTERWQKAGLLPAGLVVQLPTEAEWEKGARGGLLLPPGGIVRAAGNWSLPTIEGRENPRPRRRYPWGETEVQDVISGRIANYDESQIGSTCALGLFPQDESPYGVFELSGQVWEWVRSKWQTYPCEPGDRRDEIDASDKGRVNRGTGFDSNASWGRCAFRDRSDPYFRYRNCGFRAVVSPFTSGL
ncbi:MAG: SUMF1/EgtB/PvdO family nonheme iron enzyme [Chloroflexi bacterium]|nr:SUMF1/EgtB/PvdO family nonheme iron enzyme [Chloroflexota bacterium]MBP8059749.1 SUMF1/EgtB/PvdO family nonheme iron enzyme [Chloroflexota bacterium]